MLGIKLMLLGIGLLVIANIPSLADWPFLIALVVGFIFLIVGVFVKEKSDE